MSDLQIIAGFTFFYVTTGLGINLWLMTRAAKVRTKR